MSSKLADEAVKTIQDLASKTGLSHREIARRSQVVSQRTVSRVLGGATVPDLDTIEAILTALDHEAELVIWPAR